MAAANDDSKEEFLPGFPTVQEFSADGFKRVVNAVKAFQALPQPGPSWDLNKSYPEFSRSMKNARSKIIPMMSSLLKHVNMPIADFRSRDIDEKFEFLVETNDDLLERIGSSLDEAEGFFKKSEIVVVDKGLAAAALKVPGTWKSKLNSASATEKQSESNTTNNNDNRHVKKAFFRLRVHEKPQLKFSTPVDNSLAPFVPKLKEKPNSLKPLSILPEYSMKNEEYYGHPYSVELNKWEPPDSVLTKMDPHIPKSVKDTPVVYVSTNRDLERLMQELLYKTEIAVDLEHHSYRTFLGLTCLVQISTREKDYVIDGLSLRDQLGHLNEIFTNPKVLKVFHGSHNDIEWLQRDFGIYVVNMFDTHIAARTLGFPNLSLQYLLGRYCELSQNKSMQLADWRVRPLPNEMLEYARGDTHYLLYIYEQMRNELIEAGNQFSNLLVSVYEQSKMICLKRYEKPGVNPQLALRKLRRSLNNRQLYAFTEIYKWRDQIAREKDESIGYVLPNHMLLTIAESLPKEMNGILACCDPVPPLIQSNLAKIHKIVTSARELPLQQETTHKDKVEKKQKLKNWVVMVNSIHDITPVEADVSQAAMDVENDENFAMKTELDRATTSIWPQPWVDPQDWKSLISQKQPSMKFNRKVSFMRHHRVESGTTAANAASKPSENLSTPYGRYELSKKIVEMLKDPGKQHEVDMNDPLVKVVYEAVLQDETETQTVNDDELPNQEPAKILEDGEFIPFNPLAPSGEPKKKRRKGMKLEPWEDAKPVLGANEPTIGENLKVESEEEIQEVEGDDAKPSLLKTPRKRRNRRRGKGKFLNRLKNVFSRNKSESKAQSNPTNVDDVEVSRKTKGSREDHSSTTPPTKKMRHPPEVDHRQQHQADFSSSASRKFRQPNQSAQTDASPGQGRNSRRGKDRNKKNNKAGIFKAWKRDNNSITYK